MRGAKENHELNIILIEVSDATLFSLINPSSKDNRDKVFSERFNNGLSIASELSHAQRISIYEAALIRYFQPPFNKIFVESFPSTNLAILAEAYRVDLAAIVAEIVFDDFPYNLFSQPVEPAPFHIAYFELHSEEDRKMFFGLSY